MTANRQLQLTGRSYVEAQSEFTPELVAGLLSGDPEHGLNACVECCDRHTGSNRVALRYEDEHGNRSEWTFEQLRDLSARFANFITTLGVKPGDVVAAMLPRTPELLGVILGTWRAGAVYQPLFTAFGPKAIEHRLKTSGAKLVITNPAQRPKFDEIADRPALMLVNGGLGHGDGDYDFQTALQTQSDQFEPVLRHGDARMLMMSTSGTTGLPKGVPVPLHALGPFGAYMLYAVDLRPDDRFWNVADPGWAYGVYYAVIGPLLFGHATTFYNGPFTVESTYRIIREHGITNLAGSPTAYRLLIAAGREAAAAVKGQLRAVSSAGEPLNPEVIRWFAEHLAAPIHDHYGQTELGMVIANHHRLAHPVQPGAAGLAIPGHRAVVLDHDSRELGPEEPGELALDLARSPLVWFNGYLGQEGPFSSDGYYHTGDVAELDANGHIHFVGRNDDVITSSGYRIGPFDVESALVEHPAVLESAVVGKPDPERTEIVKAFVVLKPGYQPSPELAEELRLHVKQRLSAHAYPREIDFSETLPKTPSGKLQRFILRNQERAAGSDAA